MSYFEIIALSFWNISEKILELFRKNPRSNLELLKLLREHYDSIRSISLVLNPYEMHLYEIISKQEYIILEGLIGDKLQGNPEVAWYYNDFNPSKANGFRFIDELIADQIGVKHE
jgi:hypothetical protein